VTKPLASKAQNKKTAQPLMAELFLVLLDLVLAPIKGTHFNQN
jgi:hypothetical protein